MLNVSGLAVRTLSREKRSWVYHCFSTQRFSILQRHEKSTNIQAQFNKAIEIVTSFLVNTMQISSWLICIWRNWKISWLPVNFFSSSKRCGFDANLWMPALSWSEIQNQDRVRYFFLHENNYSLQISRAKVTFPQVDQGKRNLKMVLETAFVFESCYCTTLLCVKCAWNRLLRYTEGKIKDGRVLFIFCSWMLLHSGFLLI